MLHTLNMTSVMKKMDGHWYKIIIGNPFILLSPDEQRSRGGYFKVDPYEYTDDPDGDLKENGFGPDGTEIEVPDSDAYPRSKGKLTQFRLFDITDDPYEESDLAPRAADDPNSQ